MTFYASASTPSESDAWSNHFNVPLPCVMEIVEESARRLVNHTKLAREGRIQVIRKREYKRYPFFDGDRKWYMDQSDEGIITLIVDDAMYDEVTAMVKSSEEARG